MKKICNFIIFFILIITLSSCTNNQSNLIIVGQSKMLVGETQTLECIYNEEKIASSLITYNSLDENILIVGENGLVTALSTGTTFITVYYKDTSTTIEISVYEEKANELDNFQVFHQNNSHIILFSLLNSEEEFIKSSGYVKIQILNEFGIELYNNMVSYGVNNFSMWKTTQFGSVINEYLACSINIKDSELIESNTGIGTIKVTINDKNKVFEQKNFEVSTLPYNITITLKKTSGTFYYYNFKGTKILSSTTISNAEVKYEKAYNNKIYVSIKVYCVCNYSSYSWSSVGYKIYDKNNTVVETGKISKQVSSGTWIETENLYLDAGNYTIDFCNPD